MSVPLVIAAGLLLGAAACTGNGAPEPSATPVSATPDGLLSELREQKRQIDRATDEMMQRIERYNESRAPEERTINLGDVFLDDLSGEQKDVLNELIAQEKDASYKALLRQIVDDREHIEQLEDRVFELERTLPDSSVIVEEGDSHHALAMRYLTSVAGLDETRAETLLAGVDQTEILLPGNKVWFFYDPDRDFFRTYVTAGEAAQTPLVVRRAIQRKLIDQRDTARTRATALELDGNRLQQKLLFAQADLASLQRERSLLEDDVDRLQRNRDSLQADVDDLQRDLDRQKNTMFYTTATERDLREEQVLTRFRKEVKDIEGIPFDEELDLRRSNVITLRASDLGLEAIKAIRLLPSMYQDGRDFSIETSESGATASVIIHSPDLFRGRAVLLSVRGPDATATAVAASL